MTAPFPTFPAGHEPTAGEMQAILPLYVRKGADQSVTSSTALVNDSALFQSVLANATYEMYAFLIYDGASGTNLKIAFYGPSGATLDWMQDGNTGGNTSAGGTTWWGYNTISTNNSTYGTVGAGSKLACRPSGLLITSSTAGTFGLQFAQGGSNATAVHVFTGSWMILRRVA